MELIKLAKQYLHQYKETPNVNGGLYLAYYFLDWCKAQTSSRNSLVDEWPWITFKSKAYLTKLLNKRTNVFEFGSGGSSLFFVKYAGSVVTVEHDESWFEKVRSIIIQKKVENWQGILAKPVLPTGDFKLNPSDPFQYASLDDGYINHSFKQYASSIDQFSDGFFDLVSVDGRARPSCILHSLPKIKIGGYFMLDNSERSYYMHYFLERDFGTNFKKVFENYGPGPYNYLFWQTTIWQRIK